MYDCFIENNRVHIVLERCKDDLLSLIQNKDVPLSISDIKAIMFDVLSPLQFCHSRYIAHRVFIFFFLFTNRISNPKTILLD